MNIKSLVSNTKTAFLSQGVTMLLSIIQSLLVPKVLGITEYGYWQLFLFFASYVGFFHLGLNDGMYLINGGKTRETIDKKAITSQFYFGIAFQTLFAVVIILLACAGAFGLDRSFVVIWTGLFVLIKNAALYLGFLFQAMNETKRFSYSCILERLIFLIPLVLLLIFRVRSYKPYVLAYVFSGICQLIYSVYFARDILHAGTKSFLQTYHLAKQSITSGIKLMLANIASMLILGIARLVIDNVWGIDTFGKLSFSLSMVNFFLAFVQQASMVLFPALRQAENGEIVRFYRTARDTMGLLFPIVYLLYFPMIWILGMWLPKYASSFVFFIFLFPICVFESKMNITCTTFFKVQREEQRLFKINVITTIISTCAALIGAYVFHSVFAVIFGAVVAIIGRSMYSEAYITKSLNVEHNAISIGELFLSLLFIGTTFFLPAFLAFVLYAAGYIVFLFVFRKELFSVLAKMKKII